MVQQQQVGGVQLTQLLLSAMLFTVEDAALSLCVQSVFAWSVEQPLQRHRTWARQQGAVFQWCCCWCWRQQGFGWQLAYYCLFQEKDVETDESPLPP